MDNHYKPLEFKKVMWGKYQGTLFSEVPTDYLLWFALNAYNQMKNRKDWTIQELKRRNLLTPQLEEYLQNKKTKLNQK